MSAIVKWVTTFPFLQYGMGFLPEFMIKVLQTGPVPNHIAFVMDGNRRFAKQNQMELREGHVAGAETLGKVCTILINCAFVSLTKLFLAHRILRSIGRQSNDSLCFFN